MEQFVGLTLAKIGQIYGSDQHLLVTHLMEAGLLDATVPECHGPMIRQPTRPWVWRCPKRDCCLTRSIVDSACFLHGHRNYYEVFLAAYCWASEMPNKLIIKETGLTKNTVTTLLSEWRKVVANMELADTIPLGTTSGLVEVDETAIGKRKYNKGKRQRSSGTEWVQSMLEVEKNDDGKRKAKRLRLMLVHDRKADALQSNIIANVDKDAALQSDGWKSHQSLHNTFSHESVNHSKRFVKIKSGNKIHINSLEGSHGVVKMKTRRLNLFVGQPTKDGEGLREKIAELQFRFNNRNHSDLFLVFLSLLLFRRHKGP